MLKTFFPRRILQWLGPLGVAALAAVLIAAAVIYSGVYNLAATTPHPPYLTHILHYTFRRAVQHQADQDPPADLNESSRVAVGATHFAQVCANCHGAPGIGQSPIALAMTPRPPSLQKQIAELNDREIFWVLKHGVKYSAMPGWPTQVRDDEIWNMVAFVRKLPNMRYDQYRALAFGEAPQVRTPQVPFGVNPQTHAFVSWNSAIPQGNINAYMFPASGPNEAAQLNEPLANCVRCHGAAGAGRATGGFPNLTLQTPAYLKRALYAFATGRRQSAVMQTVAVQLSPAQMEGAAAYYAALPTMRAVAVPAVSSALVNEGAAIAARGVPGKAGAQSCNYCHNLQKDGVGVFPRLQGQDMAYLIHQLRLWRDGRRGPTGVFNPMPAVAHNLTDHEIAAVAAYFAAQNPLARKPQALGSSGYAGPQASPLTAAQANGRL